MNQHGSMYLMGGARHDFLTDWSRRKPKGAAQRISAKRVDLEQFEPSG